MGTSPRTLLNLEENAFTSSTGVYRSKDEYDLLDYQAGEKAFKDSSGGLENMIKGMHKPG